MNRHLGGIYAFHAAYCNAFGFVLVLVSRLPESFGGAICQAADHGGPTGCLDVYNTGQVLQTGDQAEIL